MYNNLFWNKSNSNSYWLQDEHINQFLQLLIAKYPEQHGLEDPLLFVEFEKQRIAYFQQSTDFVRVIHLFNH